MIKNIWINFGIYTTTLLWTILGLLISPFAFCWFRFVGKLTRHEAARKLIWTYGNIWGHMVSLFIPVVRTLDSLPKPCVIVANHASFFDMYFVGNQPEWNLAFAVRNWPFRIPFFKPFMDGAGYIKTENAPLDDILAQSRAVLDEGGTLFFYPEGTRTHDGTLGRFRSGAFHVAMSANVPIVPLCFSGTYELLPRGRKILNYSKVEVRLLPPVYPATYHQVTNGHVQMRKDVKKRMAQALAEMANPHESTSRS